MPNQAVVRDRELDRFGELAPCTGRFKTTPLKAALKTGFHSWWEMLVRNQPSPSQELKNLAFAYAVCRCIWRKNSDHASSMEERKEKYPELAVQLQEQADRAGRHFCFKGELEWVSLLMWVGADPRSGSSTLDDDEGVYESEHLTALTGAAYSENLQILKLLKPDR